ncbi:MAG: polysaccharide deacetylase family protein [bacterium]
MLADRFHVMPLRDAVTAICEGRRLPDHAAAITFDDGYLNNLETAAPILRKHGMTATFFLTTGFIDGTHAPWWYRLRSVIRDPVRIGGLESELKNLPATERERRVAVLTPDGTSPFAMMNWDQVKSLTGMGFDIGAHTVSHPSLGVEPDAAVEEEIGGSLRRIAGMTGTTPVVFAYPYGRDVDISDGAVRCLRERGCIGAVTTNHGMNRAGDDVYRLRRFNVTGRHSAGALEAMVSGLGCACHSRGGLPG